MWDWVGGRTSELSPVGLLPAALQGIPIESMLAGARDMDSATRIDSVDKNPAALPALMWFHAGGGRVLRVVRRFFVHGIIGPVGSLGESCALTAATDLGRYADCTPLAPSAVKKLRVQSSED